MLSNEDRERMEHFKVSVEREFGTEATTTLEDFILTVARASEDYLDFLQETYDLPDEIREDMNKEIRNNVVNFTFDTLTWAYNFKRQQN